LKNDGEPSAIAYKQVDYLLGMPRIQTALDEKFNAAGFSMDAVAAELAAIALKKKTYRVQVLDGEGVPVWLEREVSPSDQMRALDMRIRMTTGYAPTKTTNLNANIKGTVGPDAMFDPEKFQATPPIKTARVVEPE
jgi:hypothetical protein